jgi:hypothetical protein
MAFIIASIYLPITESLNIPCASRQDQIGWTPYEIVCDRHQGSRDGDVCTRAPVSLSWHLTPSGGGTVLLVRSAFVDSVLFLFSKPHRNEDEQVWACILDFKF